MKKVFSLLLVIAMLLASATAFALEYPLTNIETYPVESSDEVLRIYVTGGLPKASSDVSYNDNYFLKSLSEKTGIKVEWISAPVGADSNQSYNTMLADPDTWPDIIWSMNGNTLMHDGVALALNDIIADGMPDYWAWLQENPEMLKAVKTDEGDIFGIRNFRETDWLGTYQGLAIRKDWLDECGLDIPTTIDEIENVARVFKEKYGATIGINPGHFNPFRGAYGVGPNYSYVDQSTNTIRLGGTEDSYKDFLTKMHEWWTEGLIDPDYAAIDGNALKAKVLNGQCGIFTTSGGTLTGYMDAAKEMNIEIEFSGVPYPVLEKGNDIAFVQTEKSVTAYSAVITSNSKNVELAMKFLNYSFTEEGNHYWNYGDEGVSYVMVDGKEQFTDLILESGDINNALNTYTGMVGNGMGIQAKQMYIAKTNPVAVAAINIWCDAPQSAFDYVVPAAVTRTADEESMTAASSALRTYIDENYYKFVMGERDLDEFDDYMADLQKMGLEEFYDKANTQYERYLNR